MRNIQTSPSACQFLLTSRIKDQFRERRWMNLLPEHLDYQFTQILFIGERESIIGEEVIDQLEKLEEEDEARVNHLKGSGSWFKSDQ